MLQQKTLFQSTKLLVPTDEFTGTQKAYKCTGNGNITTIIIIIIAEENHATTSNSKLLNERHTKELYEAPRHVDQPHDARTLRTQ